MTENRPNKLIAEFAKRLGDDPVTLLRGPLSPLMIGIPWSRDPNKVFSFLIIQKGRDSFWAFSESIYFGFAKEMFAQYLKKEVTIKELRNRYDVFNDKVEKIYSLTRTKELSLATDEELTELMTQAEGILREVDETLYMETFDVPIALSVLGTDKEQFLKQIWEQATHPTFMSFEGRRLGHILSVTQDISSDSPIALSLIKSVRYIYTDYISTKDDKYIEQQIREIINLKQEKLLEFKKTEGEVERRKAEHKDWRKSLNDDELYIVEFIQLVMELRDIRKDPISKIGVIFQEIADQMIQRAGIPIEMNYALTPSEYRNGVAYLRENKENILKRKNGFMFFFDNEDKPIVELGNFDSFLKEFEETVLKKETRGERDQIRGQVANKGKVIGRVRVVLDPQHYKGFETGDVLVTSMTRPEFVPLMKMAGGVITNEGGITCHAAIVSRELNIPCIIGTKNATRILKDGDMVEVDAMIGLITLL